jgi:hypothetical protein
MSIFPIFKNFHSVTIPKAFVLNALVAAIVASFATEMRASLGDEKDNWYIFFDKILPGKGLGSATTTWIVFSTTFLITMIVYHVMYLLFEYGGGLLIDREYLRNGRLNYT